MTEPIANGGNGSRDTRGRFVRGNPGGPGPNCQHVAKLRDGFRSACSVADVRAICRKLVEMAKKGNVRASQLILEKIIGRWESASEHLGANGSGNVMPVFEILVADRAEAVEFNQIREMMVMQLRQAGAGPVFAGLPAPAND